LRLAHEVIAATLTGSEISPVAPNPHLAEPRGAFTNPHYRALRGCVGYVLPVTLYRTIAESLAAQLLTTRASLR
jgi:AMMECR1 domain-containing protein